MYWWPLIIFGAIGVFLAGFESGIEARLAFCAGSAAAGSQLKNITDNAYILENTIRLLRTENADREKAAIAAARLEEAEWWFTRVTMAALGEDPQSECHERIAPLRGEGQ